MNPKLFDTFKETADRIAFLDRGYGIGKPDVQSAIEKVYSEINRTNPTLEIVSVKDFGAKGDGVTDDTEAIQNAVNSVVNSGGGTIYFPKGVYLVSSPIKINDANNLELLGTPNTVIESNYTEIERLGFDALFIFNNINNIKIDSFTINGNGNNHGAIRVEKDHPEQFPPPFDYLNNNITISNIKVFDCGDKNIALTYTKNSIVRDCYVNGTNLIDPLSTGAGFYCGWYSENVKFDNCVAENIMGVAFMFSRSATRCVLINSEAKTTNEREFVGVRLKSAKECRIINNHIKTKGIPVRISDHDNENTNFPSRDCIISGNVFEFDGVQEAGDSLLKSVTLTSVGPSTGFIISNNRFVGGYTAMDFAHFTDAKIIGNTIKDTISSAILLRDTARNIKIENNNIENAGLYGIEFRSADEETNHYVLNNTITGSQSNNIQVSSDGNIIMSNIIRANNKSPIGIRLQSATKNNVIAFNDLREAGVNREVSDGSGANRVENNIMTVELTD